MKAEYLDNRDLALRVISKGFKRVRKELGDRMDPARAAKLVRLMRESYDLKDIDPDLRAMADRHRRGHTGGLVKSPCENEERVYVVGTNSRIGVPLGILGKSKGDTARVRYSSKKIVITP